MNITCLGPAGGVLLPVEEDAGSVYSSATSATPSTDHATPSSDAISANE